MYISKKFHLQMTDTNYIPIETQLSQTTNQYKLQIMSTVLQNKFKNKQMTNCVKVIYDNKLYVVGETRCDTKIPQLFVTDYSNYEFIKYLPWNLQTNSNYIAHTCSSRQLFYLHYLALDKFEFNGKGFETSIDHINRIPQDNRKENLRIISQTNQNYNQNKKSRTIVLPENCGIVPDDIPKNVCYIKPSGKFGDYFEIHIKNLPDGTSFRKKTSKSKNISLKCKLEEVKQLIQTLHQKYPSLQERNINQTYTEKSIESIKTFNEIIKLSQLPNWIKNIKPIPELKIYTETQTSNLTQNEKNTLNNVTLESTGKKKTINTLPENCGVTKFMIPKYCYYVPSKGIRSDFFVIDKSPLLPSHQRQWATTTSKHVSIQVKFIMLISKLIDLEINKFNEDLSKLV